MGDQLPHYALVDEVGQPEQSADLLANADSPTSDDSDSIIHSTKDIKFKKNDRKKNLIHLGVLLFANFLFIHCHQICPSTDPTTCARDFIFPNLVQWAIQIIIAAVIMIAIIYKSAQRKISRFFLIGTIVNIIYLGFYYHPILNARDYGQMFGLFFILSVVVLSLLFVIGLSLRGCYRKSPRRTLIGFPLFFLFIFLIFYFTRVRHSCDNWAYGLGGEKIDNDGKSCKIPTPSVCAYEATSGWLDFSRFAKSCSNVKPKSEILEKYYPDAPVYGFARTEKFSQKQRLPIQPSVFETVIPLSGINDPAGKDLEIFLDKTTSSPTYKIDVKRNQTLVNERSKIKHEGMVKNVLIIYIDALARTNAFRKLPKTMKWFDKFYNQKDPKAESFQFFKYHSIAQFTFPNLYEALYGVHADDKSLSKDNKIDSFIKTYKEKGYITGHATDYCQTSPLDIVTDDPIKDTPYDHEAISLACDAHYHDPISPYGVMDGPYSAFRRCLYGKDVQEHVFEYGNQFWRKYKEEKKILYLDFLVAHEGTGEVVQYIDDPLTNFLVNLEKQNLLEDTAVVLFADHGLHMQGLFHLMGIKEVSMEKSLPALFAVLPKKVTEGRRGNIKANQQTMVSAHELHNFFVSLAEGKDSAKLKSSLIGHLSPATSCSDIKVVEDHVCECRF